jgi:hypothetical protein
MRTAILSLLILLAGILTAQSFTTAGFEAQALAYQPEQRPDVSDKSFEFGKMVLGETVRQTENDPKAFNRADYFNILVALISLQEPEKDVRLAWQKFLSSEGHCEYLIDPGMKASFFKKPRPSFIKEGWNKATAACLENGAEPEDHPAPEAYASKNGLNSSLLKRIADISDDDQRYRKGDYDSAKQTPLDRKNERLINQLYDQYGSYLGTTLVGKAYNSVMWSVIQHSRLATMERYLPVIHKAVQAGELPETPLRMLIDRIHANKTGKQVFGSQGGVPLLPESERKEIMKQFGIN